MISNGRCETFFQSSKWSTQTFPHTYSRSGMVRGLKNKRNFWEVWDAGIGQLPVSFEEGRDRPGGRDDVDRRKQQHNPPHLDGAWRCEKNIAEIRRTASDIKGSQSQQFIHTFNWREISLLMRRWHFQWRLISTLTQTNKKFDASQ